MRVLGVSCYYHDSAAALIEDGRVLAAAEEERFTRRKHDSRFPRNAIRFCLEFSGLTPADLDRAVFYEKPLRKLERALVTAAPHGERAAGIVDWQLRNYVHRESRVAEDIRIAVGRDNLPVDYCEHHLAHAASAYHVSPFSEAAILTVDGVGEWATTGLFVGRGTNIAQLREIRYPDSLGLFYAALTAFLGFEVNEGEYKVMGLAAYGKPTFDSQVRQFLPLFEDGSFRCEPKFYTYTFDEQRMFSDRMVEVLGPARLPGEPLTERHQDIAASMQKLCEEALLNLARAARRETGLNALCMAGGVAHNVVANSRILRESGFRHLFIQPASGDSGCAIGAALHIWATQCAPCSRPRGVYDTCLGPDFTKAAIEDALRQFGANYERLAPEALNRRVAELLRDDMVVGWYQGRMEFGPRALGKRSILGNACNPRMKEILNARIKFREEFRPFAPACLEEHAAEYFAHEGPSPYMLFCPRVRPEKASIIPAVTHVDGTARVQTVSRTINTRFHAMIKEFQAVTGVPVVINTSFNVKGEPIVCNPQDALKCFYGTDIDFLAIDDFLVSKNF